MRLVSVAIGRKRLFQKSKWQSRVIAYFRVGFATIANLWCRRGTEGGRVRVGSAGARRPLAKGAAPNGRDARWPSGAVVTILV